MDFLRRQAGWFWTGAVLNFAHCMSTFWRSLGEADTWLVTAGTTLLVGVVTAVVAELAERRLARRTQRRPSPAPAGYQARPPTGSR